MKRRCLLPLLTCLALVACLPRPEPAATPTPALATISALLPTTLAAFHLPAAAKPQLAAATPQPSPTPIALAAYPAPASTIPFTPLPSALIIGHHKTQIGETIFCIGRAYGVLPAAIAQANGLAWTFSVAAGQVLQIPAVEWTNIPAGPVCAPQFQSPFPGLVMPSATLDAGRTPSGSPLVLSLNFNCVANCGARTGNYIVRLQVAASGGVQPYGFMPAQIYDVSVPHCANGQGTAAVASADGQIAQTSWTYLDVACR